MKIKNTITIGLCLIIALFSCKKEDTNVGASLNNNPNSVEAGLIDTFQIVTYSAIEDSVITSERSNPLLGKLKSDEVGEASSSLVATLIPDSLDRTFPISDFVIDSFYLKLHIVEVYGSPIDQEFEVYSINSPVNEDSTYYNFSSIQEDQLLGKITINVADSGVYSFKLDSAAATTILNASVDDFSSNDKFKAFFSGIIIKPTGTLNANEGAIFKLNRTGISIGLSFSTTNNQDDLYDNDLVFYAETDNSIFAKFSHDFTGSEAEIILNDTSLGQQNFYAQGMSGVYGKLNFPSIQNWYSDSDKNYIINKFEFKAYVEDNSTFTLPKELIFTYINSNNVRTYSIGALNSDDNSYSFVISPSEVNSALDNGSFDKMDFQIAHPIPGSNPHQIKLFGEESTYPAELKLYFTEY